MATFLDVTGLQQFSSIFVFLFVWIFVYAALQLQRAFSVNKALAALAALVIALLTLFSPIALSTVNFVAPWFGVLALMATLLLVGFKMMGVNLEGSSMKAGATILILLIVLVALGSSIRNNSKLPGDNVTSTGEYEDVSYTGKNVIFHPKVLGMIAILLVAIFTIGLLVSKNAV